MVPTKLRELSFVTVILMAGPAAADTVFLKNGALIDGKVTHRTDESILLQIGEIGKLEIAIEDIYLIEKNKRVGGELLKNSLDTKSKVEVLDKESEKAGDEKGSETDAAKGPGSTIDAPVVGEEEEEQIDPELKERIEKLVRDLEHMERRHRVRAERHLKAIGRPGIPFLVPAAKSERDLTRVAVMRLFYEFGDDRVIEPCIESLLDVNEYVRDYANKTLVRVTGEDFGFTAQATPRRRELSHAKWKKWWEQENQEIEEARRAASRANVEEPR